MTTAAALRTRSPGALIAIGALLLGCLAGFALCVALDVRTPAGTLGSRLEPAPGWTYALTGLVLAPLAALVLVHDPRQRFGRALAGLAVLWTLDGLASSYVRFGLTEDDALPAMTFALWFLLRATAFLPVAVVVILMLFPDGRLLTGRWRVMARAAVATMVTACTLFLIAPIDIDLPAPVPPGVDLQPTTPTTGRALLGALVDIGLVAAIGAFFVALLLVVVRYRSSRGLERERMRWLLWGVVVMMLVFGASLVLDSARLTEVSTFLLMVVPAVSMTIAIVHPRVVAIDELLSGTLVYGALSVGIVAVDLAALALLGTVLDDRLERGQLVLVVLLLSALIYGPLRSRLRRWVRRIMLGDRDNPYDVMAGLASRLETADEGPGQLATIAEAVAAAFGVSFVSVEVDRSRGERLVATHGTQPSSTRTLPITYRDVEVGRLVLPAHGVRARLSGRDERLLGDLVRQAAAAARATRLADDLQDSRERLVVAREEERRRIRRDLHDGLGPALSGVVFRLESARLLMDQDPAAAREHLTTTRDHVQEVVADVRRLVHDLRPPALDDRGLRGALEQAAGMLRDEGVRTAFHTDDLGALPAAVEVAAYRVVSEAMTNVARHARASCCEVTLRIADEHLLVEVADDGRGIPAGVEVGVGLLSLRERAAELGGDSEVVERPGGGTVVRARLPLRAPMRESTHE